MIISRSRSQKFTHNIHCAYQRFNSDGSHKLRGIPRVSRRERPGRHVQVGAREEVVSFYMRILFAGVKP